MSDRVTCLTYLALIEPKFVEVYAQCHAEVVLLDKRHGIGLAVTPFKAEVDDGLRAGSGKSESHREAVFAHIVAAHLYIVVGVESAKAIVDALCVVSSCSWSELCAEGKFPAVVELGRFIELLVEIEVGVFQGW